MCIPTAVVTLAFLVLPSGAFWHIHTGLAAVVLYFVWGMDALVAEKQFRGDASLAGAWVFFALVACGLWGVVSSIILFFATSMSLKWIMGLNALCALAVLAGIYLFRGMGSHITAVDAIAESNATAFAALGDVCSLVKIRLARAQIDPTLRNRIKLLVDKFATLPRAKVVQPPMIAQLSEIVREDGSIDSNNLATLEEWIQVQKRM